MQLIGWAYALRATVSVAGVTILGPAFGMTGAVVVGYVAEVAMILFLFVGSARTAHGGS